MAKIAGVGRLSTERNTTKNRAIKINYCKKTAQRDKSYCKKTAQSKIKTREIYFRKKEEIEKWKIFAHSR